MALKLSDFIWISLYRCCRHECIVDIIWGVGNCETHPFRKAVVQNRQITSRVLCRRRCLDAVFWRLMHRCERQCSESVPCGDCLFCTTEVFENIVSQLPIVYKYVKIFKRNPFWNFIKLSRRAFFSAAQFYIVIHDLLILLKYI